MPSKKKASDFRYETGAARIPWAAVGEHISAKDALEMVKFLIRPQPGKKQDYNEQLLRIGRELEKLADLGQPVGKLSLGDNVKKLEEQVRKLLGVKHAVFLTNATAGFEIGYQYAGLKPGDEVIAPAITFIATIAYPLSIGAKVVLADVDPVTLNMDPADVERKITPNTKVVIPVHLGGYPVNMNPIMKLARKHDLVVIEDAAHAFGGLYKGKPLGGIGHFGAYSFHEVKNVTSLGEGGVLVSNLPFGKEFSRARFLGLDLSRQIPNWLYDVTAFKGKQGFYMTGNHSTTEIQAVGLLAQMRRLKGIIAKRRRAAQCLNRRFQKVEGILTPPLGDEKTKPTHHLYLLQIDPDALGADVQVLKKKLDARGIVQIPHFGPLYKFSVMRQLGYDAKAMEAACPVAEEAFAHRFTHLPLYDFDKDQLGYLADAVLDSVDEMKRGV